MIRGAWNIIWSLKIPPKVQYFLWKLEHGIIPTKLFLSRRLNNGVFTIIGDTCLQFNEDQEHIFWSYSFSKKVWYGILEWWGITNRLHVFSNFNVWSWLNWFSNTSIKIGWGIALASTLWSLWINRNRGVFEKKNYKVNEVLWLIKMRAKYWCQASNLLPSQNLNDNVWFLSPCDAISNHLNLLSKGLLDLSADLYGFSDGSLFLDQNNASLASMGGFLKDSNNQIVFLFSGPLKVNSVFLAELNAILHLISIVKHSSFSGKECVFYLDSDEVVRFLMKIKL